MARPGATLRRPDGAGRRWCRHRGRTPSAAGWRRSTPTGGPVRVYVDITTPPVWDGSVLRAVDLDLDVDRAATPAGCGSTTRTSSPTTGSGSAIPTSVVRRRDGLLRPGARRRRGRDARRTTGRRGMARPAGPARPELWNPERVRIDFHGSPEPTLGVEWEFALVDRRTRDLAQRRRRPLRAAAKPRLADPAQAAQGAAAQHRRGGHRDLPTPSPRRWPTSAARSRPWSRSATSSASTCSAAAPTRSRPGPAQQLTDGPPLRGADQPHPVVGPADADLGRARARRAARRRTG